MKAFESLVAAAELEYWRIETPAIMSRVHIMCCSEQSRRYVRVSFDMDFCKETYAIPQQFEEFKRLFHRHADIACRKVLYQHADVPQLVQAFNVGQLDRAIEQIGSAAHQGLTGITYRTGNGTHWHRKVGFDRNLLSFEVEVEQV